ncbi:general substrate transporter [Dactylonectria macrodidyma]|uniref:General substrate transporter n=1 Tax=Dactylonectria macrodidyma TaxID=307937 RepID=A0A9P9EQX3_9HYPO|nr:general substrate transporter [Dactylonectria macrodidyma]
MAFPHEDNLPKSSCSDQNRAKTAAPEGPAVDDARSALDVGKVLTPQEVENINDKSFLQALKTWPFAALWSMVLSSTMIMVAYGPAWIAQLFALPAFTMRFGFEYDGVYTISAGWQSTLSACSMVGQIIGATSIAILMDKYGRKPSFIFALFLISGCEFVQFFSTSLTVLLVGTILVGVSLGCFGVLCLTYAMEVVPLRLRGALGGLYSLGIITGPLLSAAVAQAVVNMTSVWAYRIGYAVHWVWPVVLLPLSIFLPESPVWLTRRGRLAEAEAALARLAITGYDVGPDLARMVAVDQQELLYAQSTSYIEIFKGVNRRRTVIACVCYATIALTGNTLVNSGAYFLILAGIDANTSFYWALGSALLALIGAFCGLYILAAWDRRPVYIWSQAIGGLVLILVGFVQLEASYWERVNGPFGQAALFAAWNFVYGAFIGPISTVIMGEVPNNALRPKTVAFATMVQVVLVVLTLVINPYLMNPGFAFLQGYIGFIAGAIGMLCTIWIYFYVPETALTIERLELLFEAEIDARHFRSYDVAQLDGPDAVPAGHEADMKCKA